MRVDVGAAAQLRALKARIEGVAAEWGTRWGVVLSMQDGPRRPYPTLRARKGPAPAQPTNTQLLGYLAGMRRDVLPATPTLKDALTYALRIRFEGGATHGGVIPTAPQVMLAMGWAYQKWVVSRLDHEGADLSMPENSAAWTARKAKLGLSTTKLKASGQLLAALKKATPRLVRL